MVEIEIGKRFMWTIIIVVSVIFIERIYSVFVTTKYKFTQKIENILKGMGFKIIKNGKV